MRRKVALRRSCAEPEPLPVRLRCLSPSFLQGDQPFCRSLSIMPSRLRVILTPTVNGFIHMMTSRDTRSRAIS